MLKFVFERSTFLQREILEGHFWSSNSNFSYSFFRTFDQKFKRSIGISNTRPEFRTSDRNFERSTGISNVRPESRTFDRILERSGPCGPGPTPWGEVVGTVAPEPGIKVSIQKIHFPPTKNSGSPFWAPNSNFILHFSKRPAGISNVQPETRTFDQKFERSTETSHVRPEIRTFDWNLERSTGISNVRQEF